MLNLYKYSFGCSKFYFEDFLNLPKIQIFGFIKKGFNQIMIFFDFFKIFITIQNFNIKYVLVWGLTRPSFIHIQYTLYI